MRRGKLALAMLLTAAGAGFALAQAPAPQPVSLSGTTIAPHPLQSFTPITDQVLRNPDSSDWIMMRGNYQGWGYSTLDQINKSNVKGLQLVWARTMEAGINEATPIVYKGVMFLGNPNDVIQAIDAASGDLLWEYRAICPRRRLSTTISGVSASAASFFMTTSSTPSRATISCWRWMRKPARRYGRFNAAAIFISPTPADRLW
jgi:glucose dehydrogenase